MLYLEDYLELIEHLPLELRDRFTDIRERDLQVQNSTEQLNEKVRLFFADAKKNTPEQRQCDYEKLIKDYQDTMKYADNKVQIATQMHDIMIKLIQRLDTELEKFKLELEADHAGITEELEKRSLELDNDSRLEESIGNPSSSKATASGIKDRRRSEHKHRHHPYQNNQDNGYQGRAKLSNHEHNPSKNSLHRNNYNNHHHHQGSKSSQNILGPGSQHQTSYSPTQINLPSLTTSDDGSRSFIVSPGIETKNGTNLSSFGNNPSFKNSYKHSNVQNVNSNIPINQPHSALSAALAATTTTIPHLNSVSALAMMNVTSAHNRISSSNFEGNDLIDQNSQLVSQNPLTAAASQAIATTQQLQQGRRTPSLKASFAAVNAAGLGFLGNKQQEASIANNRDALAPMTPDQQATAFRYTHNQYRSKLNADNSNGSNSSPLYISVTKSGRPSKKPKHHTSHLYPGESPTSISSDNSVFENSESLSSADYIETGTTFGSTSPPSLDFSNNAQPNTTLYHMDEKKYCICRQVSYGAMVGCDNTECELEWFHYDCVGITLPPKGKWFCPNCTRKMAGHQQQQHHNNQPSSHKKRGRKEKSLFNLVNGSVNGVRSKDRDSEQSKSIV